MLKFVSQKGKWKYRLTQTYEHELDFYAALPVEHVYFKIDGNRLVIKNGYAWDGATGAIDTRSNRRGSLVHDVLFQAMRLGLLDTRWVKRSNDEFYRILKEDGMFILRAKLHRLAVNFWGRTTF